MKTLLLAASLGLFCAATPALAADQAETPAQAPQSVAIPAMLNASQRENYRSIFTDLRAQNWAGAAGRLDGMANGPLHDLARAMLYTMPNSPRVELEQLYALVGRAPELPQAEDLGRLARLRGAEMLPDIPRQHAITGLPGQPRRARARAIQGDTVADQLEPLIQPLLVADQPFEAETLFNARSAELTPEFLAPRSSSGSHGSIISTDLIVTRAASPKPAPAASPNGRSRVRGSPASPPGDRAIMPPPRAISPMLPPAPATMSSPPPVITGRRAPIPPAVARNSPRDASRPRRGSAKPSTACLPRARSACARFPPGSMPSPTRTGAPCQTFATSAPRSP